MNKENYSCCHTIDTIESDIRDALIHGAETVQEVIEKTGAMKNSNCKVNNPKGTCCYSDIVYVFNKYK